MPLHLGVSFQNSLTSTCRRKDSSVNSFLDDDSHTSAKLMQIEQYFQNSLGGLCFDVFQYDTNIVKYSIVLVNA